MQRVQWGWCIVAAALVCRPAAAAAEQRLYYLRVTTADGERYDTLSSEDPFTYASLVGGAIHTSRDYRVVWSPQVKVAVVDTWIEARTPLRDAWPAILRERGLLQYGNYKPLLRRPPLAPDAMRTPERVTPPTRPAP